MSTLPPFAALRAFDLVGQTGGIRKAAEALGVSHAIVSRHLAGLEAMLGVALLDRRSGALTGPGLAYHARIHAAIAEMAAATQAIRPRKGLTIWCAQGLALHWLTRHLPDFGQRTGRTSTSEAPVIDLRASDREPEFPKDDADGDIRYRFDWDPPHAPRDVRSEEIARPEVFAVAAPSLLARHPPVLTLADMRRLPLIEEVSEAEWRHWFMLQGQEGPSNPPVARYGQAHLTLAAARAGQGLALSNRYLCAEDLAGGRLLRVGPVNAAAQGVTLGAYVFRCGRERWSDPLLTRFRTWLRATIARDDLDG
jgi:LysR family transcriptional regulator, glycine cleavage system transcriptional activator